MSERRGGAVLGAPIAHSLSPLLHLAAYRELGLAGWDYRAVECAEADLAHVLEGLDAAGLAGVSLTMPLKRAVLPLLAHREPLVDVVGAANTVVFGPHGWAGANTDVPGLAAVLRRITVARDERVPWVVGAGATAASAVAALGSLGIPRAVVVGRRWDAVEGLQRLGATVGVAVEAVAWERLAEALAAPLVVSTVPAGAADALADQVRTPAGTWVDVVYAPWPTPVAAAWRAAGGTAIGGIELLVEQAAVQVELMTGRPAPVAAMRAAGRSAVGEASVD